MRDSHGFKTCRCAPHMRLIATRYRGALPSMRRYDARRGGVRRDETPPDLGIAVGAMAPSDPRLISRDFFRRQRCTYRVLARYDPGEIGASKSHRYILSSMAGGTCDFDSPRPCALDRIVQRLYLSLGAARSPNYGRPTCHVAPRVRCAKNHYFGVSKLCTLGATR